MLETELKCIIDKDKFNKIADFYKWDKVIVQTNHYYRDTTGELKKNGVTFRIREIDSQFKLQIKQHKNPGSALQICEESEFEIDCAIPFFTAEEVKAYTGTDAGDVFLMGSATTERYSLMWDKNTEICLDYTTYLDTEDFEIEVEFTHSECPPQLLEELADFGIEFKEKSVGKYSRFAKRFKELSQK